MARRTVDDPTDKDAPQDVAPPLMNMSEEEFKEVFEGEIEASDREKALFALFTCSSYATAAKRAGISPYKLRKLLADPSFNADLRELRNQLLARAFEGMLGLFQEATKTLTGLLRKGSNAQKIDASRLVLEHVHLSNIALRDQAESEALLQTDQDEVYSGDEE